MDTLYEVNDNTVMPFGKFKGEKMANVPAKYLLWIYEQYWCVGAIKKYIKENLEILKKEQFQ